MKGNKILLGIREDIEAYKMIDLAFRLRSIGYYVKVLMTSTSKEFIPNYYKDNFFADKSESFDFLVIGTYSEMDDWLNEHEQIHDDFISFKNDESIKILLMKPGEDLEHIVEKIQVELKGNSLESYSFLFTLGLFNEHLTNNHYIGVYENDELLQGIIQEIALAGGNISVIASKGYGKISFVEEIVYVDDIKELSMVLDSKAFKYDVVIDGIGVPRFGLAKGEKFKVEYQRYFAEFQEKYLPFVEKDLYSDNQMIIEVINGYNDNQEAIDYLFDNTCINMIMQNEIDKKTGQYKPFVKLINKDRSTDIITFKNYKTLCRELIQEFIAKLEG